jgi:hypothetical protein
MKFFENLEARQLLSAALPANAAPPQAALSITMMPLVTKLPNLVGTYTGTVKFPTDTNKFTLKITSQKTSGVFAGTGIQTTGNNTQVSFQGRVMSNRTITMSGSGSSSNHPFTFTGTGSISTDGKTLTIQLTVHQGSQTKHGTLSLKRK